MALFGKKKGSGSPTDDIRNESIQAAAKAAADQAAADAAANFDPEQLSSARVGDAVDQRAAGRHAKGHRLLGLTAVLTALTLALVALWGFSGGSSAGLTSLNKGMTSGFAAAQADRGEKHEAVMSRLDSIASRLAALESGPCGSTCALEEAPANSRLALVESRCYLRNGRVIRTGSHGSIGLADQWRPARVFGSVRLHACLFPRKVETTRVNHRKVIPGTCPSGTTWTGRFVPGTMAKICKKQTTPTETDPGHETWGGEGGGPSGPSGGPSDGPGDPSGPSGGPSDGPGDPSGPSGGPSGPSGGPSDGAGDPSG